MNVQPHAVLGAGRDTSPVSVAISPDGRTALSGTDDGTLIVWDLFDAGEIRRFEGHRQAVYDVAFAPDGRRFLSCGGSPDYSVPSVDNSLRLWDLETGEQIRVFEGHTSAVFQIAISANGRQAVSGSADGSMRLWNLETGDELRRFLGHTNWVFAVALTPDGRTGLSGSTDHTLLAWDLESGEVLQRFSGEGDYPGLVIGADGRTIYFGNMDSLVQWDLETGQEIRRFPVPCCTGLAISPDGRTAIAAYQGEQVRLLDLETCQEVHRFGGHGGFRTRVEISPDGHTALLSDWDGTLHVRDLQTGNEIRRFKSYDNGFVFDIAISPDGRTALAPGGNGAIVLWQLTTPSLDELCEWIAANRYVRELTCEEREAYRIEPLCED
jgi:WD40 repeat protein